MTPEHAAWAIKFVLAGLLCCGAFMAFVVVIANILDKRSK